LDFSFVSSFFSFKAESRIYEEKERVKSLMSELLVAKMQGDTRVEQLQQEYEEEKKRLLRHVKELEEEKEKIASELKQKREETERKEDVKDVDKKSAEKKTSDSSSSPSSTSDSLLSPSSEFQELIHLLRLKDEV
jgi:septal ring factor EnvC (AmiA/AmiB activator)